MRPLEGDEWNDSLFGPEDRPRSLVHSLSIPHSSILEGLAVLKRAA